MADDEGKRVFGANLGGAEPIYGRNASGEVGNGFPDKVTAFHADIAVRGRYGKPCLDCGAPVQRIVYAQNEVNDCSGYQDDGRLFAVLALSRRTKSTGPRRLEELEN